MLTLMKGDKGVEAFQKARQLSLLLKARCRNLLTILSACPFSVNGNPRSGFIRRKGKRSAVAFSDLSLLPKSGDS